MASKDWKGLSESLEAALRTEVNKLIDGGVEKLNGPIQKAANQLTVAIRRGPAGEALVEEIRDTLALYIIEEKIAVKQAYEGVFDNVLGMGLSLLFNGATAGLGAWRSG